MYTITEIENAIVKELQDDTTVVALAKTIAAYSGGVPDLLEEIDKLIAPFPAVWVVYGGSYFSEVANRSFDDQMTIMLLTAAKDLRGRESAAAGVFDILERLKTVLINNNLNLNIEPLHPVSIEPVAVTSRMAVYGFTLKTSFSMD